MQTLGASEWHLAETISLPSGVDIADISSDGTNIMVLSYNWVGGWQKLIYLFDPTGVLIKSVDIGSQHSRGITWNENRNKAIVARSPGYIGGSDKRLYEIDPYTGSQSGPLTSNLGSVTGLGFNGQNIMVSYYAFGSNGILTSNIRLVDSYSYIEKGTISVTVNTGTNISGTPTYGTAWHSGDLFIGFQGVNKVYRFDVGGNLIEEIPIPTSWGPHGLVFVGDDLYVADRGARALYLMKSEPKCPPPPSGPPWSFVQITDTHVGASGAEDKLTAFIDYLNGLAGDEVPDLILVTGDIAHYACSFPTCIGYYGRYLKALDHLVHEELKKKIYTIPGNHDRYAGYLIPTGCRSICFSCYNNRINPTRPQGAEDLDSFSPNDFSFEHKEFLFIGLDSGEDVQCWGNLRGTGLANPQMEALEDIDACTRKIIFMHHPVYHTDDTKIISTNRPRFINYCRSNNVQLVLTGHTHRDLVFGRNGGTPITSWDETDYPLFIQTPSLGKATHEYRIIDVIGGIANPRVPTGIVEPTYCVAEKSSAADLHIYDSLGRHVGLVGSGEAEREIPHSFYFSYYAVSTDEGDHVLPEKIIIFYPSDDYLYDLRGTEEGSYKLNIKYDSGGGEITFEATEIPTSLGARHVYAVDWSTLSTGGEGVILHIDENGDGSFEQMIIADNDLTSDEFALQTEAVIDFDPDTLNLNSEGKFATVYIELPADFDVSEIDLFSLRLNELVSPLPKPMEIGDYDSDGTNDLMVKFDRQELIEILGPGEEQMVDITGRLWDGRLLAGSDFIRVIH